MKGKSMRKRKIFKIIKKKKRKRIMEKKGIFNIREKGEKRGHLQKCVDGNDMKHLLNLKSPISKTENRIRMLKPTSYPIVVAAAGLEHATSRL